jgi:hypothetical protein
MKKSLFLLGFGLLFSAALFAQDPPKQTGTVCPNPHPQPAPKAAVAKSTTSFKTRSGVVRQAKVQPAHTARPAAVATPKK